jgi:hypothetical protein
MRSGIQYVVVSGNPFDGLTIWGPFDCFKEAEDFAICNPITDLSDETWWIEHLESPIEEEY